MINGPKPRPPHHRGGEEHPHPPPTPEGGKYISRDEFELVDSLKTMCAISFFLFAKMIALGKCGKRMAWKNKFEVTHRLGRKSCFGLMLILLTSILMWKEGKHVGKIMERVHKPHPHP